MENFLLLFDELDDVVSALRALWPQFLSFILACSLFALSILAAMRWPLLVGAALGLALLWAALPARAFKPSFRFKTDP